MRIECKPSGCQCACHQPGMTVSHLVACCEGMGILPLGECQCICEGCVNGDHCDRASCAQPA